MSWKVITSVLLAVVVVFVVLFPTRAETLTNPRYVALLCERLGDNPPPELLGGYDFSSGFKDGAKAVLHLVSFPVEFVYWIVQQFSTFVTWCNGEMYDVTRPHGFGGGVYE